MTATETALRSALAELLAPAHLPGCLWISDRRMPCQCGYSIRVQDALAAARAALALPVESRMEYRVVWTWDGHPCEEPVDSYAEGTSLQASMSARGRYKNVIIEGRTASGPWVLMESKS